MFLLTYGGTYHGLIKNCGFSIEESKAIEANYHTLYAESDAYVQAKLKQASIDGYVTVAFGLRIRTPMLNQIIWDTESIPYEASAEGRTAGNALGQSYGLLTNRATNAFMELVWASKYRYDIRPVAQIHDATYYHMPRHRFSTIHIIL
jgi:DNA polymerase-1